MESLRCRSLDTITKEIRLLSVVHDDASKAVRCRLQYHPPLSSPPCVALSCAWRELSTVEGDAPNEETILVDGHDSVVTTNLALALRTLRIETGYI
jgi:hypothetical protein